MATSVGLKRGRKTSGPNVWNPSGPIVWAVDAFCDRQDYEVQLATCAALRHSFPDRDIHPVYVLSEESFNDRGFSSFLRPALKPLALKSLKAVIADTHCDSIRKPRVLIESSASRTACARKLLRYTRRVGASVLAVSATQRRRMSRFIFGSFSEAILSWHETPLMIAGPDAQTLAGAPRVIVYPTDFSSDCAEVYPEIINLARGLGAELHLFHKTVHNIDPMVQSGINVLGGGWVSVESFLGTEPQDHSTVASKWMDEAAHLGVHARFVSENFSEPTSDAIVEYVRTLDAGGSAPIVAMVSRVGQVASWLLGSVTRDVIRTSPAPVYVASRIL